MAMYDNRIYQEATRDEPTECEELSPKDIQDLVDAMIIEAVLLPGTRKFVDLIVFTVPECAKQRRRLICWPHEINDRHPVEFTPRFAPADVIRDRVKFKYSVNFDMAAYFFQFPCEQKEMCFRANGVIYQMKAIPMGQSHSPSLGHALLVSLLERATCGLQVVSDAYIDNARLCSNRLDDIKEAARRFYEAAEDIGITINEHFATLNFSAFPSYEFLGLHYNHKMGIVSIAEKTKKKLHDAKEAIANGSLNTIGDINAVMSLLQYVSIHTGVKTFNFYHLFKWMKRKLRLSDADGRCRAPALWSNTLPLLSEWIECALSSHWQFVDKSEHWMAVFSDASEAGWGGMALSSFADPILLGEHWPDGKKHNIAEFEAWAIHKVLQRMIWPPDKDKMDVRIFMDNTAVVGALRKGRSNAYFINKMIGNVFAALPHRVKHVTLSYINTIKNPADLPSRTLDRTTWKEQMENLVQMAEEALQDTTEMFDLI